MGRVVWASSNLETDIVAMERVKEYSEVEQEAEWTNNHTPDLRLQ